MYSLIEYGDNYSGRSGSLWHFKRNEVPNDNLSINNFQSFKYKAGIRNNKKYFLPRGDINNYNVLIDGRNFYDQPINDIIKQYDKVRKVSTVYGDDYTTGWLLDYAYLKDNYRLIAVGLDKQKDLDADPRAIQQIVFQGVCWRR